MKLLLDTHILLWWLGENQKLPREVQRLIRDPANEVFVSIVSLWEAAIKISLKRLRVDLMDLERGMAESGFTMVTIEPRHVRVVAVLPLHHGDPFDRMLVAQTQTEPMRLVTSDAALKPYGELVMLV